MEKLSFLGKDRVKLSIEALYRRCDLILIPTEELTNWLIADGHLNSEIRQRVDKNIVEMWRKMKQFNCVGVHRKKTREFTMDNNGIITVWRLDFLGRSYELIFSAQSIRGTNLDFYSIELDKRIYSHAVSLSGNNDRTTWIEIAIAVSQIFGYYVSYYALNPFVIYEDLRTHGNGSTGEIMTRKKREENVIPLTLNHHKHKIRNGVNVMNTITGRIYPSIAETSRKLDYPYGMLWQLLKDNTIPPLKRIEKLNCHKL